MAVTAIVEVHLTDERLATVDAAKALFRSAPEVQQCYYVTGGRSFIMLIVAPDMRSYEAITRRLFAVYDEAAATIAGGAALAELKVSRPSANQLLLTGTLQGRPVQITLDQVDLDQFTLRNRGFHWVQEYPFFK